MQNDKMVAEYLVQSLKDNLDDLEDKYTNLNREYKHIYRECDLLVHNHERIKKEYQILQQSVKNKRELIEKNGLTISNHQDQVKLNGHKVSNHQEPIKLNGHKETNLDKLHHLDQEPIKLNGHKESNHIQNKHNCTNLTNGSSTYLNNSSLNDNHSFDQSSCSSTNDKTSYSSTSLIFSEELYQFLSYLEGKTLNEKINYLLHDKINKMQRIKSLKSSLDDEKIRSIKLESLSLINGKQLNGDVHRRINQNGKKTVDTYKNELELLDEQTKQLRDHKSKIEKEIIQLQARLQTMEDIENELKSEKRKMLRQFRESQAKIDELDTENYHLQKRIDKLSKNSKISNNFD